LMFFCVGSLTLKFGKRPHPFRIILLYTADNHITAEFAESSL